jgi:hypothetical protein
MPQTYEGIWIRIAVVRRGDDPDETMVWRVFPERRAPAAHVRHCELAGESVPGRNLLLDEDPKAAGPLGLRAWIDVFGDLRIEDGVARIALKLPA